MKLFVDKKYLILPLGFHSTQKKLKFFLESELAFDVDATIDAIEPDYFEYLNMEYFDGKEIEIKCDPDISINLEMTNELPNKGVYCEKYRPQIHFSAQRGWINDPNGLVHYKGCYHMFFQYNPAGHRWGNMHWGHAVSNDLLHWEEKDCALYPDELGTMFSGCGIVDKNNVTGLKENDNDVVLLYYTAAGGNSLLSEGKKFTQCLAFSTDGGVTFKKYDNNPIVSHIEAENRDPKVIYSEELQEYVMTLFLNENRYAILTSKDLLKWKTIQELALEGDAECPDFYPLALNGDKNNIKWVLSGASDRYLVGEINNNAFHPIQPAKRLHYGRNSYASQTFSDIDEKDGRRIRIAWNTMEVPDTYFNDSMCFPTEMSLKSINGEPNLCTWPIDEIKKLYENTVTYENKEISGNSSFMAKLDGKALDMELDFITDDKSEFSINLFGMEITCKVSENLLQMCNHTMPLCRYNGKIKLRLLVDTLGAELFTDEGEAHMCIGFLCDYNLNNLTINPQNGNIKLLKCNISTLKSIWKEKI